MQIYIYIYTNTLRTYVDNAMARKIYSIKSFYRVQFYVDLLIYKRGQIYFEVSESRSYYSVSTNILILKSILAI